MFKSQLRALTGEVLEAGNVIQSVAEGSKLFKRADKPVADVNMWMSLLHNANIINKAVDIVKIIAISAFGVADIATKKYLPFVSNLTWFSHHCSVINFLTNQHLKWKRELIF